MKLAVRVKVAGSAWPERVGALGEIVTEGPDHYPFHATGKDEVILLLDDDPVTKGSDHEGRDRLRGWSCVMPADAVVVTGYRVVS